MVEAEIFSFEKILWYACFGFWNVEIFQKVTFDRFSNVQIFQMLESEHSLHSTKIAYNFFQNRCKIDAAITFLNIYYRKKILKLLAFSPTETRSISLEMSDAIFELFKLFWNVTKKCSNVAKYFMCFVMWHKNILHWNPWRNWKRRKATLEKPTISRLT